MLTISSWIVTILLKSLLRILITLLTKTIFKAFRTSDHDLQVHDVKEKIVSFTGREVDEMAEDEKTSTKNSDSDDDYLEYADDETPEDETPENETPEDETPEDEYAYDETPEDETPEDEYADDETPEDETHDDIATVEALDNGM